MVESRDHDFVARIPGPAQGARQLNGEAGHVLAEHYLSVILTADEVGAGPQCVIYQAIRFHGGRERHADVGVLVQQIVPHGITDRIRGLTTPRSVEEDGLTTVDHALQTRKLGAHLVDRESGHETPHSGAIERLMTILCTSWVPS